MLFWWNVNVDDVLIAIENVGPVLELGVSLDETLGVPKCLQNLYNVHLFLKEVGTPGKHSLDSFVSWEDAWTLVGKEDPQTLPKTDFDLTDSRQSVGLWLAVVVFLQFASLSDGFVTLFLLEEACILCLGKKQLLDDLSSVGVLHNWTDQERSNCQYHFFKSSEVTKEVQETVDLTRIGLESAVHLELKVGIHIIFEYRDTKRINQRRRTNEGIPELILLCF